MFVKFGLRYGASDMAFLILSFEEKSLELGFVRFSQLLRRLCYMCLFLRSLFTHFEAFFFLFLG